MRLKIFADSFEKAFSTLFKVCIKMSGFSGLKVKSLKKTLYKYLKKFHDIVRIN